MNDPIALSSQLKSLFLRYLDSYLPLQNRDLMAERRRLLSENAVLNQPPIIEPLPPYPLDQTIREFCRKHGLNDDLASFAHCGLFRREQLYVHQLQAVEASLSPKPTHMVVTTGTGSGKTECFLIPLFARMLDDLSRYRGKERPRAVRALLLYPLNALAEDQVTRIREAADSTGPTGARHWLDQNRGDRIYFGRYNGMTPVSGRPGQKGAADRLRLRKKEMVERARLVANDPYLRYFFTSMGTESGDATHSSEMWDRWSMQASPPDFLVTNYSMLNIMLMRDIEAGIFEATRQWLAGDPEAIFNLVVDELHSYRGTAGTEIAYLLRQLLDRLGLTPDSPQLRIQASSASLSSDGGKQYLQEFFGVSDANRFRIISGERQSFIPTRKKRLVGQGEVFAEFSRACPVEDEQKLAPGAVQLLADGLKLSGGFGDTPSELGRLLRDAEICAAVQEGREGAETVSMLGNRIFGNKTDVIAATTGLLKALSFARIGSEAGSPAPLPIRAHLFFRSLFGLWACSNPNCRDGRTAGIGTLYSLPRMQCGCGGRILDLLACQSCGETFLGGYCANVAGETFLVHDQPNLELVGEGVTTRRFHVSVR